MDLPAVEQYLKGLQQSICDELSAIDGSAQFETESWDRPEGGGGISRVLADGKVFEKGGVNFSYVEGGQMPGSATQHRPELAGRSFKAMGVSLVMHPQNPIFKQDLDLGQGNAQFLCNKLLHIKGL